MAANMCNNAMIFLRSNGPELSCGDVQPDCRRMLVRAVMFCHLVNSISRGGKARRTFRQLERVVRRFTQLITSIFLSCRPILQDRSLTRSLRAAT